MMRDALYRLRNEEGSIEGYFVHIIHDDVEALLSETPKILQRDVEIE